MNRQKKILEAYSKSARRYYAKGKSFDKSLIRTLLFRFAWNIKGKDNDISHKSEILSWIDDDFDGKMLEVPCANGMNTLPYYKKWNKGTFVSLDYTEAMLELARENAREMKVDNVTYVQGDVGNLQFADEEFDKVFSWMGFHVFPDKEKAYEETYRVLKKGGEFIGCFYIKGEVKRTDWVVEHVFVKEGSYTGPFETKQSLMRRLESMYEKVEVKNYNSVALFRCVK